MKSFLVILSLLIMSMSVIPCADVHTCDEEISIDFVTHEVENQHDHANENKEPCTPFCFCTCCGSIYSVEKPALVFHTASNNTNITIFYYSFDYTYTHSFSVWNPPVSI